MDDPPEPQTTTSATEDSSIEVPAFDSPNKVYELIVCSLSERREHEFGNLPEITYDIKKAHPSFANYTIDPSKEYKDEKQG